MTVPPSNGKKIPRVALPPGTRLDTLAVREGLPPSAWGENSEALFLTSSFVQPDAATAAARFANEEEAFIYSRFTNPTVTMFERRLQFDDDEPSQRSRLALQSATKEGV